MRGEDRFTPKTVAAEMLPHLQQMRAVLAARLVSLSYGWKKVDGLTNAQCFEEAYELDMAGAHLRDAEEMLCRLK